MQVCTLLQTDNHTPPLIFLLTGCPSCRPTNSVKALKALYNVIENAKEFIRKALVISSLDSLIERLFFDYERKVVQ